MPVISVWETDGHSHPEESSDAYTLPCLMSSVNLRPVLNFIPRTISWQSSSTHGVRVVTERKRVFNTYPFRLFWLLKIFFGHSWTFSAPTLLRSKDIKGGLYGSSSLPQQTCIAVHTQIHLLEHQHLGRLHPLRQVTHVQEKSTLSTTNALPDMSFG